MPAVDLIDVIHFHYNTAACRWSQKKLMDFLMKCGPSFYDISNPKKTHRNLSIISILFSNAAKALMLQKPLEWGNRTFFMNHELSVELSDRKRTRLASVLEEEGILQRIRKGYSHTGRTGLSLWAVSPKLLSYWEGNDVDALIEQYPPVEEKFPKDKERRVLIPEGWYRGRYFNDHDILNKANREFLSRINLPATPFVRSYQSNGKISGRVYTSIQQYKKHIRREWLTIDGEAVAEPDFEASHVNIIHRLISGTYLNYDPYNITDKDGNPLDRKDVKNLVQCLLNAKRPKSVFTGNRSNYKWSSERYETYKSYVMEHLPFLKPFIHTRFGLVAQWIEGEIAVAMIKRFTEKGEVIIPIHDSYVCRASIAEDVTKAMEEERESVLNRMDLTELMSRLEEDPEEKEDGCVMKESATTKEKEVEARGRVKQKADSLGEFIMKEADTINKDITEAHLEYSDEFFYELIELRLKAYGIHSAMIKRLIDGLRREENVINDLYKEDVALIEEGKQPRWFT